LLPGSRIFSSFFSNFAKSSIFYKVRFLENCSFKNITIGLNKKPKNLKKNHFKARHRTSKISDFLQWVLERLPSHGIIPAESLLRQVSYPLKVCFAGYHTRQKPDTPGIMLKDCRLTF